MRAAEARAVDIIEVAKSLRLRVRGRVAYCPFHQDRNPSLGFYVSAGGQRFHCFGCGARGSPIDLVMMILKVDFKTAMQYLEKGEFAIRELPPAIPATIEKLDDFLSLCRPAWEDPFLLDGYLKKRNIGKDTAKHFNLHLVHDYRWISKHVNGIPGIVNAEGNLIFYRHDLLIPFTKAGVTRFLIGRARFDHIKPKYLNAAIPKTVLFNQDAIDNSDTVYLVEGVFDAMSLYQIGKTAVAFAGVSGANLMIARILDSLKGKRILAAFDNDIAGETASRQAIEFLRNEGLRAERERPPRGKDWNEAL